MSKFSYFFKLILFGVILYFLFNSHFIPEFINYLIAGYFFVLFISPRTWFWFKNINVNIFRKYCNDGIPDKDKLNILIMLFRLRYLEIYDMYARFRYRQQEAGKENWILLYLKEEASHLSEMDAFSDKKDAKIAKKEKKANEIFARFFDFDKLHFTDDRINSATDLEIEFLSGLALSKLSVVKSFGHFQKELDTLINNYLFLDDTFQENFSSRFEDFKINKLGKEERRAAYQAIRSGWHRLFNILKAYLIFFEDQKEMKEFCNSLFSEIEVLEEMISNLSFALRQKNARDSLCGPKETTEKIFFEKVDSNPLWKKSFL